MIGHFVLAFTPGIYFREGLDWSQLPLAVRGFVNFPAKFIWDGHMAVSVFFVLSGFVLSLSFFQKGSAAAMGSAAIRRYPRLMLPVAVSILFAFVLLWCGAICNQSAVRYMNELHGLPDQVDYNARNGFSNKWLALYYCFTPDFSAALQEAAWGAFTGVALYNLVLWTMPFELTGSFLVYGFLALFGSVRNRAIL